MVILSIVRCLLLVQPLMAGEGVNGNLVTVGWLEQHLKSPDVVLLDASPSTMYKTKHIPGAINYDIFTYGVQETPVADVEKRYQSWGISRGKKIVMYDQGGTYLATRLFFSLEYYGFPAHNLFVLNGGLSKWEEAGLPVTNGPTPSPEKGTFTIRKPVEEVSADLPEFLVASGDTRNNALLEALDPDWHFGANQFFGRPGHIPNAIMLPSGDFFNPDKTFKSAEEIQKMLDYLGIRPDQNIYSHCGGGIAASVPYFALRSMLQYPHVKLYPGSQLEWVSDRRELPLWTYDAPFLLRESHWLQSWGGRMMRMYGLSHVSIIDIRSEEKFKQGHIPFALNIPADIFKNHVSNPNKLAEFLGAAGVKASNEAVVVSGAGLTRDAALAFVLLEKVGQTQVSVFADSLNKWAERGFSVTKETTLAASETPPVSYPVNLARTCSFQMPTGRRDCMTRFLLPRGSMCLRKFRTGSLFMFRPSGSSITMVHPKRQKRFGTFSLRPASRDMPSLCASRKIPVKRQSTISYSSSWDFPMSRYW